MAAPSPTPLRHAPCQRAQPLKSLRHLAVPGAGDVQAQAIGAYLVAGAAIWLIGITGVFERLVAVVPQSLCAAMLAGILLRFGTGVFALANAAAPGAMWLVAGMFMAYLVFKRRSSRYAVVWTLLTGAGRGGCSVGAAP